MDEWSLEALELKAWMVTLGTEIGEISNTRKLGGARRIIYSRPLSLPGSKHVVSEAACGLNIHKPKGGA